MSIVNAIREKSIVARKAKDADAASLLITLLSEVSMVGKNANRETTDAEAIAVVKKFINNNRETLGVALKLDEARANALVRENIILESFLPKQMSELELDVEIRKIILENSLTMPNQMGLVMKVLKEKFEGTYDAKTASAITKKLLG